MLSAPKMNDMWYDELSKLVKDEKFLHSLNQAIEEMLDGQCLVMKKISNSGTKLTIGVDDCNYKHSTVCRVQPKKSSSPKEPPKFPCMTHTKASRKKRNSKVQDYQDEDDFKGIWPDCLLFWNNTNPHIFQVG